MAKKDLNEAKESKNNEFYTQLNDIEKELNYYREQFKDKTVYCNCDDPFESNFFKYFALNFKSLGLKKLICTSYAGSPIVCEQLVLFGVGEKIEYRPRIAWKIEITETPTAPDGSFDLANKTFLASLLKNAKKMKGDGDFRSEESIKLLKQADIVVTNPPFSLFREYIDQLIKFNKKFIVIGNTNALSYQEIFSLFKKNMIRTGYTNFNVGMFFGVPNSFERFTKQIKGKKYARVSTSCWFSNMEVRRHNDFLDLYKEYKGHEENYPKYDNYDAINVDNYKDIPCDYDGVIGVPITFMDKYCPDQFELIGLMANTKITDTNFGYPFINGVKKYARVLIRRK